MRQFAKRLRVMALAALVLGVNAAQTVPAQSSEIDPAATTILKRMTDYLGALDQFSVNTQNTLEIISSSGHRIDTDVSAQVVISRPDKIRAIRRGDMLDQDFYYDGTTLTLYNPSDKVYASIPAPATFEELFTFMFESLGFAVPISDLVYSNAFPLLMKDVTMATVVGRTSINSIRCYHLFFSTAGADFQVWVADGAIPLPLKYVVTDTTTPALLSISTLMSNWNLAPGAPDSLFTFVPPEGATPVDFMPFSVQ